MRKCDTRPTLWMIPGCAVGLAIYLLIRRFVIYGEENDALMTICCLPFVFLAGALGQKYDAHYKNLKLYDAKMLPRLLIEIVLWLLLLISPAVVACLFFV